MLQGRELRGRAVLDLAAAEKVGVLNELVLDPSGRRVAGLIIDVLQAPFRERRQLSLASSVIHAVGPDAITIQRRSEDLLEPWQLASLPRVSHITGRKAVTQSGKLLGTIDDVLIDGHSGQILGYALGTSKPVLPLRSLFSRASKAHRLDYVRADVELSVGPAMVIVPDAAVVYGADIAEEQVADRTETASRAGSTGWGAPVFATPGQQSAEGAFASPVEQRAAGP